MSPCPTCHRPVATPSRRLALVLDRVAGDWVTVRTGAHRSYVYKLRDAYPQYEWRSTKTTPDISEFALWNIEARRWPT